MTAAEFKTLSPLQQIRTLSGIMVLDEKILVARLALINLITRVELGDSNRDFLNSYLDKVFGDKDEESNEAQETEEGSQ